MSEGVPTQQEIVGRLFFQADTSDGEGFPSFTDTFGLRHSIGLATYLRQKFGIPESRGANSKLDFWNVLQSSGFTLETLYSALEKDPEIEPSLLQDFEAIVRAAVSAPLDDRTVERVCAHHRRLCEALEPGDYIVNFNWDAVMADALLYYSHFWFPSTGFGVPVEGMLIDRGQKAMPVESLVFLLHVHGSTALFQRDDEDGGGSRHGVVYVGPKKWSPMTGMEVLARARGAHPSARDGAVVPISDDESRRLRHGWLYLRKQWFRPLFVPPSHHKPQYGSWYATAVRRWLHAALPTTQMLVFAGYSLPPADLPHLQRLFVPDIQREEMEIVVVNLANDDPAFRDRYRQILPKAKHIDFATHDFRQFCRTCLDAGVGGPAQ